MGQKRQIKDEETAWEFPETKAVAFGEGRGRSKAHAKSAVVTRRIKSLALLGMSLVFVGFVLYKARIKASRPSLTTATHAPATLIDEVERLRSPAWKIILLSLPYNGIVNIDVRIMRGNPIDVLLTAPDQLDDLAKRESVNLRAYEDFSASRTEMYRRAGRLNQGKYYLLVRDTSLGTGSSLSTDISVKVQLSP